MSPSNAGPDRPAEPEAQAAESGTDPTTWIGARAEVSLTVTDVDTAQALGSGDVPVLATPRVVALVEAATVRATARRIATGTTTVGTRIDLRHTAATPIGATVVAEAELVEVSGRSLRFEVIVRQATTTVATGSVERVLLDRRRFLAKATGSG